MNAEYLLDAVGLLDDDLLREAEEYRRPRRDYRPWIGLAACLAVALTLGYALTHLGMGGGAAPENQASGGAASAPAGSYGGAEGPPLEEYRPPASAEGPDGSDMQVGGSMPADPAVPQEPGANGSGSVTGDWLSAIRVDGVVYRATNEYIHLEPEESDIRYTTSFINSSEPEEDGQANFLPVGIAYVVLDDGTAAVYQEDNDTWRIFDSVPPWEK